MFNPNEKRARQQALFLAILSLLLVFMIALQTPADADMWWHLAAGRAMWDRGEILLQDIFSFTRAGSPWTNAFWVSETLMYLVYRVGGFFAITLGVAAMAVLTMIIVYKHAKSPLPIRMSVVLLATVAVLPIWTPRPQLASFFFVAVLDAWLSHQNECLDKRFWLLIPLFALWPNFHGGFIFGFLLLAAFVVGKLLEPLFDASVDWRTRMRKLAPLSGFILLSGLAVGLNPNGLAIWKLPFYTIDVSLAIQEWHSPNFHSLNLHPILWLLFLVILALGFSTKKASLFDLFKTLGFAYMTFYSQRSLALFVIIAAPVAARYLSFAWDDWKQAPIGKWLSCLQIGSANRPLPIRLTKNINLLIVALILAATLVRAYALSLPVIIDQNFPKDAVNWVKTNHPQPKMFNSYNWGGYLIWELPDYPVFIDGRADLYGDEITGQWWEIVNGTDRALALLDEWDVSFVLLEPDWPIEPILQLQGWLVLYQDDYSTILGRK